MRKRNALCAVALMLCVLILLSIPCHAINTGFVLQDVPEEKKENYIISLNLKPVDAPMKNASFYCFDVNEKGQYALGFNTMFSGKVVNVYDADGTFLYGFSFNTPGSFYIEWDGDNIIVYLVRDDLAFAIDSNITCVEVADIPNNQENQKYWRGEIASAQRKVNDVTYQAKPGLLAFRWKLVALAPDGTETVLFHEPGAFGKTVVFAVMIGLFFAAATIWVIYSAQKNYKKHIDSRTL